MAVIRDLSPSLVSVLSNAPGTMTNERWKVLCRNVLTLSQLFTRGRQHMGPRYLNNTDMLQAYVTYFLPVNLAKVQSILDELPDVGHSNLGRRGTYRVLDVGCGPGTVALGALDWVLTRHQDKVGSVEAVVVDDSRRALQEAKRLWGEYARNAKCAAASIKPVHLNLEAKGGWPSMLITGGASYDLIGIANCLNEFFPDDEHSLRRKVRLIKSLWSSLSKHGSLVIVEPALRNLSRDLHELRNALIDEGVGTVYSPCLHERPCPALVKPQDWCHEERSWVTPSFVAHIDGHVGFLKDALKFSYLVLRKDGQTIVNREPQVYRVVSELRELKGEKRAWLCNETGRCQVGRLDREWSEINQEIDHWHRGDIVKIETITRKRRDEKTGAVGRIPSTGKVQVIRLA